MVLSEAGGDGGGARVSVAQRNARAAAAPKLRTGAARCGHLIFMVRFSLGGMARRRRERHSVGSVAESRADTREEDGADQRTWRVSGTREDGRCGLGYCL